MVYLICVIFENFKARRSTKHGEYLLKKSFNTKLFKIYTKYSNKSATITAI